MNTVKLLRLNSDLQQQEFTPIRPERVVDGAPEGRSHNQFSNAKDNFFVGVWESTEGCWELRYTEDEFCVILEGEAVISDQSGEQVYVVQGDAFTIPAGFLGTWKTIGHVKKWYAIYEE